MTTAFQPTKQVAIDASKSKRRNPRCLHRRSTSSSRERQQTSSKKQPCTNCGFREHTTSDSTCPAQGTTCGYCRKSTIGIMCASRRNWMKRRRGTTLNLLSIAETLREKANGANLMDLRSQKWTLSTSRHLNSSVRTSAGCNSTLFLHTLHQNQPSWRGFKSTQSTT